MNKKDKIEHEISRTLEQFDQAEKLPPNPYFYTRVQARLEAKQNQQNVFFAILRPAMLTALVVLNLSTAFWYLNDSNQAEQANTRTELIELLSSDLNLEKNQSTIFDIN